MNTQIEKTLSDEVTTLSPDEFPDLLRHIPSCPKKLYIEGALPTEKDVRYLCVVGSRRHSKYGADACRELIAGLAGYNICIVSGLALGIDAIAHEAALSAGLHTIAFPGSGLQASVLYPERNHQLARRILTAGGALISEFEMDFQATPWSFPQRNRLMAGMSHATLVIEAGEKSGTLITARLALDFNRDVLAVPGSIFSSLSRGPHELIRDGAAIIKNSQDILYALGIKENNKRTELSCTAEEKYVLDILCAPMQKDDVIRQLEVVHSMDTQDANCLISLMELSGFIGEDRGMLFAKKITSV